MLIRLETQQNYNLSEKKNILPHIILIASLRKKKKKTEFFNKYLQAKLLTFQGYLIICLEFYQQIFLLVLSTEIQFLAKSKNCGGKRSSSEFFYGLYFPH